MSGFPGQRWGGSSPASIGGASGLSAFPEAIKELARLATKARSETSRLAAIRELLDRGYGKPSFDNKVALEIPIRDRTDRDNGGQVITIELVRAPKRDEDE
jgi:hypothetical protein